jgi:hypothetical protein
MVDSRGDWIGHIVYVGASSKELRQLTQARRTMIVRGDLAPDRDYRKVRPGDTP